MVSVIAISDQCKILPDRNRCNIRGTARTWPFRPRRRRVQRHQSTLSAGIRERNPLAKPSSSGPAALCATGLGNAINEKAHRVREAEELADMAAAAVCRSSVNQDERYPDDRFPLPNMLRLLRRERASPAVPARGTERAGAIAPSRRLRWLRAPMRAATSRGDIVRRRAVRRLPGDQSEDSPAMPTRSILAQMLMLEDGIVWKDHAPPHATV